MRQSERDDHAESRRWRFSRRTLILSGAAILLGVQPLYLVIRNLRRKYKLVVEGPFTTGRVIKFEPTESSLVRPDGMNVVRLGSRSYMVEMTFEFRGPEVPSRNIEVVMTALDSGGNVVLSNRHVCNDQRIFAREMTGKRMGSGIAWFDPRNSVTITLPAPDLGRVSRIESSFREL